MIRRRPAGDPISQKIVVKGTGHSPYICSEIRRGVVGTRKGTSVPFKIVVERKHLDPLLAGTLQDMFTVQDNWEYVEMNASSKVSLRLLQTLSQRKIVQTIFLHDPCELVLQFLGGWLGNQDMSFAIVNHVMIKNATIVPTSADRLRAGLSSSFCRVTSLELSDTMFESMETLQTIAKGIAEHGRLKKLTLRSCHLEDFELAILIHALQHHSQQLIELCLSVNYCQDKTTSALEQMLISSTASLQKLDVSNQDTWDDRRYYIHYVNALSHPNCPLRELDMSSNFVGDEEFIAIIRSLEHNNTTLELLNLSKNRITNRGMNHLVQALPHLSLKVLNVSHNEYGPHVVMELEHVLKTQTTLTCLSIDYKEEFPKMTLYLAWNRSGRYCKSSDRVPLGLWPILLERCQRSLTSQELSMGITEVDVLFELVHGPALLER